MLSLFCASYGTCSCNVRWTGRPHDRPMVDNHWLWLTSQWLGRLDISHSSRTSQEYICTHYIHIRKPPQIYVHGYARIHACTHEYILKYIYIYINLWNILVTRKEMYMRHVNLFCTRPSLPNLVTHLKLDRIVSVHVCQNWKDAVRNSIQLSFQPPASTAPQLRPLAADGGRRNLNFGDAIRPLSSDGSAGLSAGVDAVEEVGARRPLTRAAFTRTLLARERERSSPPPSPSRQPSSPQPASPSRLSQPHGSRVSVFDVRGLARLRDTFAALDNSVNDIKLGKEQENNQDGVNILVPNSVRLRVHVPRSRWATCALILLG